MKTSFTALLIKIILVGILLTGFILFWTSLQSFDPLATLLNRFPSDGNFEAFTVTLYQRLRIPIMFIGISFTALASFLLIQSEKTEAWLRKFLSESKRLFTLLKEDTVTFGRDIKTSIVHQGWLINSALAGIIFVALVMRLRNLNIPLGLDGGPGLLSWRKAMKPK